MKNISKAAAPIRRRMSFQDPLSDPFIRFLGDGGDGSAVGDGGAPAGDSQGGEDSASEGDFDTDSTADGKAVRQVATPDPAESDDEQGSQADDPKLRAARDEAYKNRQKANTAAQEKDDLIQTLGKALGLVKDDDEQGKGPDLDALTAQIADEQAKSTEAARELAVYKAAATNGADPAKLLDSRGFLASIAEVDHKDANALGAAIKAAVDGDPNFASRRAPGASTADTASGPGGGSAPKAEISLADAVASHYNN